LSNEDLSLLRRGKSYALIDEEIKTRWIIHPFAFQMHNPSTRTQAPIILDSEHSEYQAISPDDLERFDHVPQLEKGLHRVLVSPVVRKAELPLVQLRRRDAHTRAPWDSQYIRCMLTELQLAAKRYRFQTKTPEELWKEIRWTAWHLAKIGPTSIKPAIQGVMLRFLSRMQEHIMTPFSENGHTFSAERVEAVKAALRNCEPNNGKSSLLPYNEHHFVHYIESLGLPDGPVHVLVLSTSKRIAQSLLALHEHLRRLGKSLKISILGRNVKRLKQGLERLAAKHPDLVCPQLELVPDEQASVIAREASFIILGADCVYPDGSIGNIFESSVAASVALNLNPGCRLVSILGTDSIINYDLDYELEIAKEARPWDLLRTERERGKLPTEARLVLEWIPTRCIHAYITEEGPLTIEQIAAKAVERETLEENIWGDL
jgi:hypothetical protein